MRIIKISAYENGAHENMNGYTGRIPDGWAAVPNSIEIPASFPFVDISVENQVVTRMTAREVPQVEPEPETPSQMDRIEAQVLYTALETGTLLEVE